MASATPRRRVLRPPPTAVANAQLEGQRNRLHDKVTQEREHLRRWMSRLKRAFTAVQKHHNRLARIERKLNRLGL